MSLLTITSVALVVGLGRVPTDRLRDALRQTQFWTLAIQFVGLLTTTSISLPKLISALRTSRRSLYSVFGAVSLSFLLAAFVAPRTSRIFYDEQIYQSVGQNLSDLRLAQMCNEGDVEYGSLQCWRGEYNKEPYGYPFLLSVAYSLTGVHESTAFIVNATACAAFVFVVFLVTTALTSTAASGLFAALIFALMPETLRWSHTAAVEPTAALTCAVAVLSALAFVRLRTAMALAWMVAATAFAVQFRTECLLIVPVVALVVLLFAADELTRPRVWWASCALLALTAVHVGHLLAIRGENWGATGPRISFDYAGGNLHSNGLFYLADSRFPVVYTLLVAGGVLSLRRHRELLVLVVYFFLFWSIFVIFYAGSYNYGADERFSLMTFVPLVVLAGAGAQALSAWVARRAAAPASSLVAAAICLQFVLYLPFVRSIGEEAWGARADIEFARAVTRDLPKNSMVLTHNPNMFHVWGQSAAQMSIETTEPGYVRRNLFPKYAGGVYVHWNFWCNTNDPQQQSFCPGLLARFPHTLVREYRERDYRYAFYRLEP